MNVKNGKLAVIKERVAGLGGDEEAAKKIGIGLRPLQAIHKVPATPWA
jgi:hypothetical protein